MTDTATQSEITARKPSYRSAVTNGSEILPGVDGRLTWARRLRDIVKGLLSDLGPDLSEADRLQVNNAASLQVHAERLMAMICNGQDVDPGEITRASNSANRALSAVRTAHRLRSGQKTDQMGNPVREYLASRNGGVAA
jgi:hypothetical protein